MAYVSLGTKTWGDSPSINIAFSYDSRRIGTAMEYKLKLSVASVSGSHYFGYPIYLSASFDGTSRISRATIKSASPSQWSSAIVYESAWIRISNKTSGTTSLSTTVYSGSGSSRSDTYSFSLPVIPTVSDLTNIPTFYVNSAGTLTINRHNSNYTDTITYKVGTKTGTIVTETSQQSVSWTPPMSLYLQMIGKTSVSGTLTITTYSGSTSVGNQSYTFTLRSNVSYSKPSITRISYERGTGNASNWVQDELGSDIKISFSFSISSVSGQSASYSVKLDGSSISSGTETSSRSFVFYRNVGTDEEHKITASVTDAAGASITKTLFIAAISVPLNINFDTGSVGIGTVAQGTGKLTVALDTEFTGNIVVPKESITLTVVSGRLTNLSYTAKYYPTPGIVFVRAYGTLSGTFNTGYDYDILNVGSRLPDSQHAISVKSAKMLDAAVKPSGVISVRPHESIDGAWDIFITGFWFA